MPISPKGSKDPQQSARPAPTFGREFCRFWFDSPFAAASFLQRGWEKIGIAFAVVCFHGLALWALSLVTPKAEIGGGPRTATKVTLVPRAQGVAKRSATRSKLTPPKVAKDPKRTNTAKSAPSGQKQEISATAPKIPLPKPPDPSQSEVQTADVEPNDSPNPSDNAPSSEVDQVAPPSTSSGMRRFLPSSSSTYLQNQREIGKTIGEGPIAGEMDPTPSPPSDGLGKPPPQQKIVEREYSLAHYFAMLNSRFSESWGPEQILPRDTTFYGVIGEQIEYDVIVNRDGTLRKIVNVTAQKQPWRDFRDVDAIVGRVFKNVFPLNEIPPRIAKDPVVIRKRIQYTGSRYSLF